jgi:predicted heme/steroid binding protein
MRLRATHLPAAALVVLLLVCLVALSACGGGSSANGTTSTAAGGTGSTATTGAPSGTVVTGSPSSSDAQGKAFTLDELAAFNGQNGTAAYVAVDGVVYDVSNSSFWNGGTHSSCNLGAMAGQDLSELIKQAPARMRSDLQRMPVVGSLAK